MLTAITESGDEAKYSRAKESSVVVATASEISSCRLISADDFVPCFLTYIIHRGFVLENQNGYRDNSQLPVNVFHRMIA